MFVLVLVHLPIVDISNDHLRVLVVHLLPHRLLNTPKITTLTRIPLYLTNTYPTKTTVTVTTPSFQGPKKTKHIRIRLRTQSQFKTPKTVIKMDAKKMGSAGD